MIYEPFLQRWSKYQTAWIISDTHFNATLPGRPSTETLLKNLNSKIGKKDILFLLGDVGDLEVASKLKGYKILIMGNHDCGATKFKEIFQEVYEGPLIIGEKLILSHEPLPSIPWAINIHGHNHLGPIQSDLYHYNVAADLHNFSPINFNQWLKKGYTSKITTLHRTIINRKEKNV